MTDTASETRKHQQPAATVISLVPFAIDETKPGMSPSQFYIDPAPEDSFSCLVVSGCKHGVYLDEFRPVLVVPTAPDEVAQAICFDYKMSQLSIKPGEAEPGLFWVPGRYGDKKTHQELKGIYASDFKDAERKQLAWFKVLVEAADDAWAKFKMRQMVSVPQRVAAQRLKLTREWLIDAEVSASLSECPVCFEKVHPRAIVCRGCNAILNETEYAKRKFAIAGVPAVVAK